MNSAPAPSASQLMKGSQLVWLALCATPFLFSYVALNILINPYTPPPLEDQMVFLAIIPLSLGLAHFVSGAVLKGYKKQLPVGEEPSDERMMKGYYVSWVVRMALCQEIVISGMALSALGKIGDFAFLIFAVSGLVAMLASRPSLAKAKAAWGVRQFSPQ